MRGTYITAGLIGLVILLWLLSGALDNDGEVRHPSLAETNRERTAEAQDTAPPRVRVRVIQAAPQVEDVVLRGRTENKRTVEVKAETSGRVVERPAERGTEVAQGDLLCRIHMEDREAGLAEARAALEQARIEHQASLRLKEQGFQSRTAIAQAEARLAAAEAQVARRELDIERTRVRAPFTGVVEDVHLEVGDYVTPGGGCATIVDMNPMLLKGRVSERRVSRLELGQTVTGTLSDGRQITGPITFVGQQADPATRTYAVEAQVPNPDHTLRSGLTTDIRIPVNEVMAHKISPALFSLSDEGQIGVRTVNDDHQVEYHPVNIVREDASGVWVTGLPELTTLITVGHELVIAGQKVDPVFEATKSLPAKADGEAASSGGGDARAGASDRAAGQAGSTAVAAKP